MHTLESKQMLKMSSFGTNSCTQTFAINCVTNAGVSIPSYATYRRCFSSYRL